jgi:anaerobic C4-dicarboxylate transporter
MSRMASAPGRRSGRWSLVRVAATVQLTAVAVALAVAALVAVLTDVQLLRAWGAFLVVGVPLVLVGTLLLDLG